MQRHGLGINWRTESKAVDQLPDEEHPVDVRGSEELDQNADDGNRACDSNGPTSPIKAQVSKRREPGYPQRKKKGAYPNLSEIQPNERPPNMPPIELTLLNALCQLAGRTGWPWYM